MAETSISTPEQYADWIRSANPTRDALAESLRRWRDKGVKPPLSIDCPSCGCTEFGWRDLSILRAAPDPTPPALDAAQVLDWLEERGDDQRMADAYQLVGAALALPDDQSMEGGQSSPMCPVCMVPMPCQHYPGVKPARPLAAQPGPGLREALEWAMRELRGSTGYNHPPECSPIACVCGWKRAADALDDAIAAPDPLRHSDGLTCAGPSCGNPQHAPWTASAAEALRRFGRHLDSCATRGGNPLSLDCDCGLALALGGEW